MILKLLLRKVLKLKSGRVTSIVINLSMFTNNVALAQMRKIIEIVKEKELIDYSALDRSTTIIMKNMK